MLSIILYFVMLPGTSAFGHLFGTDDTQVAVAGSIPFSKQNTESADTIDLMRMRRIETILTSVGSRKNVPKW
jgi:hypothetical protein